MYPACMNSSIVFVTLFESDSITRADVPFFDFLKIITVTWHRAMNAYIRNKVYSGFKKIHQLSISSQSVVWSLERCSVNYFRLEVFIAGSFIQHAQFEKFLALFLVHWMIPMGWSVAGSVVGLDFVQQLKDISFEFFCDCIHFSRSSLYVSSPEKPFQSREATQYFDCPQIWTRTVDLFPALSLYDPSTRPYHACESGHILL